MFPLAILALIYAATKRKDALFYLPGFVTLFITFMSTNVEAVAEPDLFNFFEHFCILLTGIFLLLGALADLYFNFIKKKVVQRRISIPKKEIGGT